MHKTIKRVCDYLRTINGTRECQIFKTTVLWTVRSIIGLMFVLLTGLTIVYGLVMAGWLVDQARELVSTAVGIL